MAKQLRLALALAIAACACAATGAVALAANVVRGATYAGTVVRSKGPITLRVAKSGKAVTVSVAFPPLYCEGGGVGTRQITKAAPIARNGSFKASIAYEFEPTHTTTAHLVLSGRFSGRTVKGTARSQFPLAKQCEGSTTFTARAR